MVFRIHAASPNNLLYVAKSWALAVVLVVVIGMPAFGQNTANWTVSGGVWSNPNNWSCVLNGQNQTQPCVPDATFNASVVNGGAVTVDTSAAAASLIIDSGSSVGVGSGSSLSASGGYGTGLVIGDSGSRSLSITGGGIATAGNVYYSPIVIGSLAGSSGAVTVDGSGSQLNTRSGLNVGLNGKGSLLVEGGGVVNMSAALGFIGGNYGNITTGPGIGTVTVTGPGSQWNSDTIDVGNPGQGNLTVENGGVVNMASGGGILFPGSTVTISGAGSALNGGFLLGYFFAGATGVATLTVQDGAAVNSTGLDIGDGGNGLATLAGAGTTWTITGQLDEFVGFVGTSGGSGTLEVESGAKLTASVTGFPFALVGYTGTGIIDVNGGVVNASGIEIELGGVPSGTVNSSPGNGTLKIENGGVVNDDDVIVGFGTGGSSSSGTVSVAGPGSQWNNQGAVSVGDGTSGTVNLSTEASATGGLYIGTGATGVVTLTDTGTLWSSNTQSVIVGNAVTGTLTIENDAVLSNSSNDTIIGNSGTGTLTISGGGQLNDANGFIANNAGSTGTATVSGAGSQWMNSGNLNVGNSGRGTVTISSGGIVSDAADSVGVNSGSNGTITVSGTGSQWNNSDAVSIGVGGQGTVTLNTGATGSAGGLLDIGVNAGSTGTMSLTDAGTTWENNTHDVIVGDSGTGTLKIQNGAALANAGQMTVGNYGKGTLSISGGSQFVTTGANLAVNKNSTGSATVSGAGSWWNVQTQLTVGYDGKGTLGVSSKGLVTAGIVDVGLFGDAAGKVTVSGAGSSFQVAGQLIVGDSGQGSLSIASGAVVSDGAGIIALHSGPGTVTVSGAGSVWHNGTTLDVGFGGKGMLTVSNGGLVAAGTLKSPGTITIDKQGTVNAKGGTLQGKVINHGVLDPGGVITINGDYTQDVDGTLILDVTGTGAGEYGQLAVSGNATFDGTVDLDFIDGFAPTTGNTFDFINVMGTADFSGATLAIGGLLPGFQYSNDFSNGQFVLTALNNGVSSGRTPEPATLLLFGTALLGLAVYCRLRQRGRTLSL